MQSDAFYSGITEDTMRKIRFRKYIGRSGKTWLVGLCHLDGSLYDELRAEMLNEIYVSSNGKDMGYGGDTLQFQLEDGSVISLKGPWHSNPNAFTRDTGIELLP